MSGQVEVVVKNVTNHGEGPHWDDITQTLYYVDCFPDDVYKYDYVTGQNSKLNLGDVVMTIIIPREKGGFIVTQDTELAFLDSWEAGTITGIVQVEKKSNMMNDGKCDATGRLWVGSAANGKNYTLDTWPRGKGALYSLETDLTIKTHMRDISLSNGMDWTADNRTMFYTDTFTRQVWSFDFDLTGGIISNRKTVFDMAPASVEDMGYPDGLTIDVYDKIWLACVGAGKVLRIDPDTGKVIQTVSFPANNITSCCFGGKNLDELYVTSSRFQVPVEELQRTPLAGSLFKVTGLGVKGRKANKFSG